MLPRIIKCLFSACKANRMIYHIFRKTSIVRLKTGHHPHTCNQFPENLRDHLLVQLLKTAMNGLQGGKPPIPSDWQRIMWRTRIHLFKAEEINRRFAGRNLVIHLVGKQQPGMLIQPGKILCGIDFRYHRTNQLQSIPYLTDHPRPVPVTQQHPIPEPCLFPI